jgi:DnaJ-class molecular chaperone
MLRRNGARLSDDFTRAELKSAFRALARGLHPDMHPRASSEERRWLAAAFRDAREAYLTLLA